ncbi:MAG: fimbrillin family protein [Bacteroidaceae bacterium]|nr:fimbrillin family protein [Bacteroidaceae bacterium]
MKKILSLSVCVLAFASCSQQEMQLPAKDNAVDFQATIGTYSVRATDTSFENGDQVAIIAMSPINSGVRKYVYSNGSLTSDNPISWADGQSQSTDFRLYYPYKADMTQDMSNYEFTVNADQTTHQLYTASDLMMAGTTAAPNNVVRFNVNHMLSKVQINITNNSDKTIKDVYFSDVYGKCTISGDQTSPCGTRGTIKACPVSADGSQSWILILPPQTSQPQLIVTTENGEQITYTLPSAFNFKAGYQANARVTLTNENIFTDFSATINDWLPDNDLQFTNGGQMDGWRYLGTGKWLDDILASTFGIPHYEMDVDVYEDESVPGRYMIMNPYKNLPIRQELANYQLSYSEGAAIIVNASDDQKAYIESGSSTGIISSYGEIRPESTCCENGYDFDIYGYSDYEGCWQFGSILYLKWSDGNRWTTNYYGRSSLTLPGHVRYPVYYYPGGIDYIPEYEWNSVQAAMDNRNFGISILEGTDIYMDDIYQTMAGTHASQYFFTNENYGDNHYSYSMNGRSTGLYTILAAGDCTYADGEYYYGYSYRMIGYVAPGDEAPYCEPVILSATVNENNPLEIDMTVKVEAAEIVRYVILDEAQISALNPDSCMSYTINNGISTGGDISSLASGKKVQITGLQPDTRYTILLYAKNLYGQEGFTRGYAATGGEYEFTSIGSGTFHDNIISAFTLDSGYVSYNSTVEILQEKTGRPIYRVSNPYRDWWNNYYWAYCYNGLESDYIEFYTKDFSDGTYVFFKDFYNGASYLGFTQEGNPLIYHHGSGDIYDNPEYYSYSYLNKQISAGVFQIAPMIRISGTNYCFSYYDQSEVVIICLPGYEYNGNAQTRAPLRSAAGPLKPELIQETARNTYY